MQRGGTGVHTIDSGLDASSRACNCYTPSKRSGVEMKGGREWKYWQRPINSPKWWGGSCKDLGVSVPVRREGKKLGMPRFA